MTEFGNYKPCASQPRRADRSQTFFLIHPCAIRPSYPRVRLSVVKILIILLLSLDSLDYRHRLSAEAADLTFIAPGAIGLGWRLEDCDFFFWEAFYLQYCSYITTINKCPHVATN